MNIIKTPDGGHHHMATDAEVKGFMNGFRAALRCYGIWKDGKQVIGCMDKPVVEAIRDMKNINGGEQ